MTKSERSPKSEPSACQPVAFDIWISDLIRHSEFVIRHSYLSASIGSTFAARRARSHEAYNATSNMPLSTSAFFMVHARGTNASARRHVTYEYHRLQGTTPKR